MTDAGNDGDILARALDVGLAEFDHQFTLGHRTLGHVEVLVFEKDHGVLLAQGIFEQALGVSL